VNPSTVVKVCQKYGMTNAHTYRIAIKYLTSPKFMLKSYMLAALLAHMNQTGLRYTSEPKGCGQDIPDRKGSPGHSALLRSCPLICGLIEAATTMGPSAP